MIFEISNSEINNSVQNINLEKLELKNGIYIVQISINGVETYKKLVINK